VVHFKLVQEVEQERGLPRALMENIPDLIYFKDRESALPGSIRRTLAILAQKTRRSASGRAMRTISRPKTPCVGACKRKRSWGRAARRSIASSSF
jgi:hypothetical protein